MFFCFAILSRFGGVGVGALNLAWTIQQVPETIIGSAIAIALLPTLAEFIDRAQSDAFRQTVNRALRVMLALSLPAAALLALCAAVLYPAKYASSNAAVALWQA